jgi:hypothetical protein
MTIIFLRTTTLNTPQYSCPTKAAFLPITSDQIPKHSSSFVERQTNLVALLTVNQFLVGVIPQVSSYFIDALNR